MQESKKKKSRTIITSSGRASKTPKHLQTSTEEEAPPRKKTKSQKSIAEQKEHLRNMLKSMEQRTQENVNPNRMPSKSKFEKTTVMNKNKKLDDRSAVIETSSQNIESESKANTSKSYSEQSKSHSLSSIDPIEVMNYLKLTLPEKISDIRLAKSSGDRPVEENPVNISRAPPFDYTKIARANMAVYGERCTHEELNKSSHYSDKSPEMSELKGLIKDLKKECALMHQYNKDIKEQNAEIKQQNTALKEQYDEVKRLMSDVLSHSNRGEADLSDKLFEPLEGFPLQSKAQFDMLNSSHQQRKTLYKYLKSRSGTKIREFLSIAMKITMTDELVSQFTWLGNETHGKFGDTRVSNVFYVAARNCPHFVGPRDKDVYKSEMLEVLRSTKQRYRKSKKKSTTKGTPSKSNNPHEEEETVDSDEEQAGDDLSAHDIARALERLNDVEESETEENFETDSGDEFGDDEED